MKPVAPASVSVVVPCYRCEQTIERAVESVAKQTLLPAEIILVDDASSDATPEVLRRLQLRFGRDWIRIVELERNAGPATARNAGWEVATQKYVAFLDADDAWHPRKIEIQLGWMEQHPEAAVSGHAAMQLQPDAESPPVEVGEGAAQWISKRRLYRWNPFVTPSVMLRRNIVQRFEGGKRHMEDYLLWLEIASAGLAIAKLPYVLAYTFKAPYGEAGQSAQPWAMEKGELAAFSSLRAEGRIGNFLWLMLCAFSLAKYTRRVAMLLVGYSPATAGSRPPFLYPLAYLLLTQGMTAVLVFAGLLGRRELAADIGIVQAATLATFYAFSGNARNLILNARSGVAAEAILAARLVLLLPLGAAAMLASLVAGVEPVLAGLLIVRRAVESIAEVHLTASELTEQRSVAWTSLVLQAILTVLVVAVLGLAPAYVVAALAVWAVAPGLPLLRFVGRGFSVDLPSLRGVLAVLVPHYGSTAVSGFSLYAFRTLIALVAGKAIAGDLFVAFAIGSFPGTLFANVLGPSVSLHEQRIGRAYLPRPLWLGLLGYVAGGLLILAFIRFAGVPAIGGRTLLFWDALGWSLLGGAVMIAAQRMRIRLLSAGSGQLVFAADVLIHVFLVAAVPALYGIGRVDALAALYALNAVLALAVYVMSTKGLFERLGSRADLRAAQVLALLVFLPLFFTIGGELYNPTYPVWDSGGVLKNLPLPVSVLGCSLGVLLVGRFASAIPALWTILGLLLLMLLSAILISAASVSLERAKMLLMLQILLPAFGLVLGQTIDPSGQRERAIAHAIVLCVAMVVPVQLLVTWSEGTFTLSHSLRVFAVYQHLEFVPVILVCGFLVAVAALWRSTAPKGKAVLAVLFALLAIYASASYALLAMFAAVVGIAGMALLWTVRDHRKTPLVLGVALLALFTGYTWLVKDTDAFRNKFRFLFPVDDYFVFSVGTEGAQRRLFGGWEITGLPATGVLVGIGPPERRQRAVLQIEGVLREGILSIDIDNGPRTPSKLKALIERPGQFKIEIPVDRDRGDGDVHIGQIGSSASATITSLRWIPWPQVGSVAAQDRPATGEAAKPDKLSTVRNLRERFSDWRLFGGGVFDSAQAFLLGHDKPLSRDIRTSAHNYFIDFAYNFGIVPLVPLLLLGVYTAVLVRRRWKTIVASDELLVLAAVTAFLVVVDSNFKVSLRQPYSGIAIYFLWGLLLARLQAAGSPSSGEEVPRHAGDVPA